MHSHEIDHTGRRHLPSRDDKGQSGFGESRAIEGNGNATHRRPPGRGGRRVVQGIEVDRPWYGSPLDTIDTTVRRQQANIGDSPKPTWRFRHVGFGRSHRHVNRNPAATEVAAGSRYLSVGATGFEPATSCSRSTRSTGLSYAPLTVQHPRSERRVPARIVQCAWKDSNLQPSDP